MGCSSGANARRGSFYGTNARMGRQTTNGDRHRGSDWVWHAILHPLQRRLRFISYQRDNLQHLKRELNGLGSRVREVQAQVLQSRQAIERHHRQKNDLKMQLQECEEKTDKLQEDLDQDSVEGGRLDALRQGLKEAEDEKAHYEHQFEDSVISRDRLNEESAGLRRQLEDISTNLISGEAKLKKAEVELLKLQNQRQAALEAKNSAFDDVNETREERDKTSAKHEAQEALIIDYTRQAEEISARVEVDPGETPDSLDRKLTKLSEDLKRFQKKYVPKVLTCHIC